MAKKSKVYAVKYGVNPTTKEPVHHIICSSWSECESYVKGVPKAEFKSFKTKEEALSYFEGQDSPTSTVSQSSDTLYAYVDGSFNEEIPNYSFGLVCVKEGAVVHRDFGLGNNQDAIEMRQVGGELLGAIKALLFAKKNNYPKVVILHDYQGVSHHATGEWKRSNNFSKIYHQWMQNFFKSNPTIQISFQKVAGHTGDDFNEIADGLAKKGAGLKPNAIYYRMLEKYNLQDN